MHGMPLSLFGGDDDPRVTTGVILENRAISLKCYFITRGQVFSSRGLGSARFLILWTWF